MAISGLLDVVADSADFRPQGEFDTCKRERCCLLIADCHVVPPRNDRMHTTPLTAEDPSAPLRCGRDVGVADLESPSPATIDYTLHQSM